MSQLLRRCVRPYLFCLLVIILCWLWVKEPDIASIGNDPKCWSLIGIAALYLCSHLVRMLRLALLTLDRRDKILPLTEAHALTAFPSSFLPFKIGEVLRLGAFFQVYDDCHRKALAVWLAERFGDVLVIGAFILSLSLLHVDIPSNMRTVFIIFEVVAVLGLLSMFAVATTFIYLNRHLVLTSHTPRGLKLLRASHALRQLEVEIYHSVNGRLSAFALLSLLIWALEILALSLFINQFSVDKPDFATLFTSGLLASLLKRVAIVGKSFGLYQSLALLVLTIIFPIGRLVKLLMRSLYVSPSSQNPTNPRRP
jgi:hypothetical protein